MLVDKENLTLLRELSGFSDELRQTYFSSQLLAEHLTPGARGSTEVHHLGDSREDVELVIDL